MYLDPPFNSNKNYSAPIGSVAAGAAFKDTWTLDDVDLYEHGELADRNAGAYKVIDAARTTHGASAMSYLIYMGVRLLELHRLLKPTGSLYLHCDPTMSHYLKLLLDAVFGASNFVNEIIWRRQSAHNDTKQGKVVHMGRIHDTLLYYSRDKNPRRNAVYMPYSKEYIAKTYKHRDADGRRYALGDLTAPGGAAKGNPYYKFMGVFRYWRFSEVRMHQMLAMGKIVQTKVGNVPLQKRYLDEMKGIALQDLWLDINPLTGSAKEKLGYPTQKPLALLDRIIRASSNEGDLVFDPFCGCATSLVAADRLGRDWVGCDLSPLAAKLVDERIRADRGALWGGATVLDTYPQRTDLLTVLPPREHKHYLYGLQEGVCSGCQVLFPFKNLTIDHIVPVSKGGQDHLDNLQLLCGYCNSSKGAKTMSEWQAGA